MPPEPEFRYKQCLLIRADLKISCGKRCAQLAHAAVGAYRARVQGRAAGLVCRGAEEGGVEGPVAPGAVRTEGDRRAPGNLDRADPGRRPDRGRTGHGHCARAWTGPIRGARPGDGRPLAPMILSTDPLEASLGLCWYANDAPGIGGRLRDSPEEFVVEECESQPPLTGGPYLVCRLTKRNWEQSKAVRAISDRLGISHRRISFAGTKDRRAVTTRARRALSRRGRRGPCPISPGDEPRTARTGKPGVRARRPRGEPLPDRHPRLRPR